MNMIKTLVKNIFNFFLYLFFDVLLIVYTFLASTKPLV